MLFNRNHLLKRFALCVFLGLVAGCSQVNNSNGANSPPPSPGAMPGGAIFFNASEGTVQGGEVNCNQEKCEGEAVVN